MPFSNKLLQLRREREMTQEDIAVIFGVTNQSVSKWERGETYPDITLLPKFAQYFEVTIDYLLNDINEYKERIREIYEEQNRICYSENSDAAADYLKNVLKDYPNEWQLWFTYATYRGMGIRINCERDTDDPVGVREAIDILERILRFCTDHSIRQSAELCLAAQYSTIGDHEKAQKMTLSLPSIYDTGLRELMMPSYTEGGNRAIWAQTALEALIYHFYLVSRYVAPSDTFVFPNGAYSNWFGYTPDERILILEKSIAMLDLMADGGEVFLPQSHYYQYRALALIAAEYKDADTTVKYITKAAEYIGSKADNSTDSNELYRSVMINRLRKEDKYAVGEADLVWFIDNCEEFNAIRNNEKLVELRNRLAK